MPAVKYIFITTHTHKLKAAGWYTLGYAAIDTAEKSGIMFEQITQTKILFYE